MENKYYTPSIEEFHVGFEFELLTTLRPGAISTFEEWKKYTVKDITWFEVANRHFEDLFDRKHIRIKYLDKEDIESLGFVKITEDIWDIATDHLHYRLIKLSEVFGENKYEIRPTIPSNLYGIYLGIIKNKSELKKVLKMIGVIE